MPNKIHVERTDGRELCPLEGNSSTQKFLCSLEATTASCSSSSSSIFIDSLAHLERSCDQRHSLVSEQSRNIRNDRDDDDMLAVLLRHSSPGAYKRTLLLQKQQQPSSGEAVPHESITSHTHDMSQQWQGNADDDDHNGSLVVRRLHSPSLSSLEEHVPAASVEFPSVCLADHDESITDAIRGFSASHMSETMRQPYQQGDSGAAGGILEEERTDVPLSTELGESTESAAMGSAINYSISPMDLTESNASMDLSQIFAKDISLGLNQRRPKARRHGSSIMTMRVPATSDLVDSDQQTLATAAVQEEELRIIKPRARRHGSNIMTMGETNSSSVACHDDQELQLLSQAAATTVSRPKVRRHGSNIMTMCDSSAGLSSSASPAASKVHPNKPRARRHGSYIMTMGTKIPSGDLGDGIAAGASSASKYDGSVPFVRRKRRHGSSIMTMDLDASHTIEDENMPFATDISDVGGMADHRHHTNTLMEQAHASNRSLLGETTAAAEDTMSFDLDRVKPRLHGSNFMVMRKEYFNPTDDANDLGQQGWESIAADSIPDDRQDAMAMATALNDQSKSVKMAGVDPSVEAGMIEPRKHGSFTTHMLSDIPSTPSAEQLIRGSALEMKFDNRNGGREMPDAMSETESSKHGDANRLATDLDTGAISGTKLSSGVEEEGNIFLLLEEKQREQEKQRHLRNDQLVHPHPDLESLAERPVFRRPKTTEKHPLASHKREIKYTPIAEVVATDKVDDTSPRKHVRFGTAEVRVYGLVIDCPGGLVLSSKTKRKRKSSKGHIVACPLALDWAYASHIFTYSALELGYTSYFCNSRLKPLTAEERRLRVAAVNDWSWEELHLAEVRALCQQAVDLITGSYRWKLLPSKHWLYQKYAVESHLVENRWSDVSDFVDLPPVDRSRHRQAMASEVVEWERATSAASRGEIVPSSLYSSDDALDAELQNLVRLFNLNQEIVANLDFNRSEWQFNHHGDDNGQEVRGTKFRKDGGESLRLDPLLWNPSDEMDTAVKPSEILSQQPTLLDSFDPRYRMHQGGRVAIARDDMFRRQQHETPATRLPALNLFESRDELTPPLAAVAPFEIVPFPNMDGLQLTEGRGMPDRREPLFDSPSRLLPTNIPLEESEQTDDDVKRIRTRRRVITYDL